MLVTRKLGWLALSIGCADPTPLSPTPELVRAVDINPDPAIVEIDLVATESTMTFDDGATPVLAYRDGSVDGSVGTVPGPLIESTRGERLIVHFHNELQRDTTVHWHGLRLPIDMDGDPTVNGAVPPGGTFDYDITLEDAGLFWYHPHVTTDEQIELGLQGPLLVHDTTEPAVDADRVFVLDDVDLVDHAIQIEPSRDDLMLGRRGDTLLVNGMTPGRIISNPGALERWRFVNTSNGRFFDLSLRSTLRVIGWDGGLVATPYDVDHLMIAPGERYDVLVTLDRERSLVTLAVPRGTDMVDPGPFELVRFELEGEPVTRALPVVAGEVPALATTDQTTVRRLQLKEDLDGPAGAVFFINDERWPFNNPIDVTLGTTEILELVNDNDHEHPFHIHGHFVQVLGSDPLGWKDTVVVAARSTVRVALQYGAIGKWMLHCQIPEHAERGMTADLNVIP